MVRTCVGYTGGTTPTPTYRNIGDHSEALQIEFDPGKISYRALLDLFWRSHNPRSRNWSTQYRNAVFVHDQAQHEQAQESLITLSENGRRTIRTPILQAEVFYPAEDYHQKYYLRHQRELWSYFTGVYPTHEEIVRSTAAARVNGLLRGHGEMSGTDLQALLPKHLLSIFVSA